VAGAGAGLGLCEGGRLQEGPNVGRMGGRARVPRALPEW